MKVDGERVLTEFQLDGCKMLESYQMYMGFVGRHLFFLISMLTDRRLGYGSRMFDRWRSI